LVREWKSDGARIGSKIVGSDAVGRLESGGWRRSLSSERREL